MIIPEIDSEIISQTTTLIKIVQLTCGTCLHTNKVKIANSQQHQQTNSFPQVNSSLEQITANSMKHLTQILYLQRRYTIEDIYQFSLNDTAEAQPRRQPGTFVSDSDPSKNSNNAGQEEGSDSSKKSSQDKNQKKKKKVFYFRKGEKRNHQFIKRNTKNIPKNFCKAFANYMEELPNKQGAQWKSAMKHLKAIQKKQNYNNKTMTKILKNQAIVPFFKDFLTNHAQEWIKNSKIRDKTVHFDAIKVYLQNVGKHSFVESDPNPSDS